MQQDKVRRNDGRLRPVNGHDAVRDAGRDPRISRPVDLAARPLPQRDREPRRGDAKGNFDGIAVVVGKPSAAPRGAERPGVPRPDAEEPPRRGAGGSLAHVRIDGDERVRRNAGRVPVAGGLPALPALRPRLEETVGHAAVLLDHVRRGGEFLLKSGGGAMPARAEGTELAAYVGESFAHEFRIGLRVLLFAVIFVGGWATFVPLSGAVVIPGTLVAETNIKKIQHQTGGIVSAILVHDGMRVKEGELLVRLDETQARSNFQMVDKQLEETRARIARLTAERDGREAPPSFRDQGARSSEQLQAEGSLFNARSEARRSQRELLRNRISQLNEEIGGMEAQIKAKKAQSDLIAQDLEGVKSLFDKHLVPLSRLTQLQREGVQVDGERGQLMSSISETRAKISESELQLVKLDQDFRSEVMKDLREAQSKESELTERKVATEDLLNRVDIKAPNAGVVTQLAVHTVGGVVGPAEVMMVIVPESDELQIDGKLPANEIDQVAVGQDSIVRFSAFNQQTTPELNGKVSHVSADVTHDQMSTATYYTVRVTLAAEERARLGGLQLVSGMPAEVFLQTGSRTMMSYLFKPLTDQLHRMFRER